MPSRNFNHVLKTINMYTFKPAEVSALEEAGNKKAKKYWLHFYDPDNPREYKVDMDDPKSVLEFMKLKYEQKKWCVDQPKKEETKKEGGGKKKKKKDEESVEVSREGEPSREKADHKRADSDALKLKEPAKGDKEKQRSRKSTGAAASGGEGQSKAGGSSAGGLDFLSSLDNLSFSSPAPAQSAQSGRVRRRRRVRFGRFQQWRLRRCEWRLRFVGRCRRRVRLVLSLSRRIRRRRRPSLRTSMPASPLLNPPTLPTDTRHSQPRLLPTQPAAALAVCRLSSSRLRA